MAQAIANNRVLSEDILQQCYERAPHYDQANSFFNEDFEALKRAGYLTIAVPEELGGKGLSLAEVCQEQRNLAYYAHATALAVNMHIYWTGVAADLWRAGDTSLEWLLEKGYDVNYVCCLYPTAPFIKSKYLKEGFSLLKQNNATSVFPVTTFRSSIFRALKINENQRIEMFWPEYFNSHSQDLQTAYYGAGQFYWADVGKYLVEKSFYSNDAIPLVLPNYLVQDIDTQEDWDMAEMMFKMNKYKE